RHIDLALELRDGRAAGLEPLAQSLPREWPVVAVCAQGRTSVVAADYLRGLGFRAFSLRGGMRAWSEAWNIAPVPLPAGGPTVIQVRRAGKGCLSYLVVSEGRAAVIDPAVAPGVYLDLARRHGAEIEAVLDTHVHADHVSRAHA